MYYLLSQGTEMQKPVLSLLQGSGELTVAKLQGQSGFFDLAQVTGAEPEQVLIKVGGRRYLMDVTQGLAMRDRWNAFVHQGSTHHRGRCMHTQVCTFIGSLPTASLPGPSSHTLALLLLLSNMPPYSQAILFGITLNFQSSGFFCMSTFPTHPH